MPLICRNGSEFDTVRLLPRISILTKNKFQQLIQITKGKQEMKNQKYTPEDYDGSLDQLDTYSYTRGIGAYKPHFAGVPENYYPLNCKEITMATIILVLTIGFTLGVLIGFIFWIQAGGLDGYIIAWVTVFLVFTVLMIILFYLGGKARRRMEKELIAENNRRQQEMIHGKKNIVH